MKLREYTPDDNEQIVSLFFDTVHSVNAKDYTMEQLNVWAPIGIDVEKWCYPFVNDYTVIAEDNGQIIGFANVTQNGYYDRLFVHKNYQNQGIAKMLTSKIEEYAREKGIKEICSNVSITAKSFFEKQGYVVERENTVERLGQQLLNYKMKKSMES